MINFGRNQVLRSGPNPKEYAKSLPKMVKDCQVAGLAYPREHAHIILRNGALMMTVKKTP